MRSARAMTDEFTPDGAGVAPAAAHASAEDLQWLDTPPPAGPPWDLSMDLTPWVFIDCEMTGVDPRRDAVIEVAALRIRGGEQEGAFDSLVRTEVPSHPAAQAAHGIDGAALLDAPGFDDVAPDLERLLDGAVPVLHGAALDRAFLNRAFERRGSPARLRQVIDTLVLSRRAVLADSYRLASVCERVGVAPHRWHRAREDVLALEALFDRLRALLRPESARDLWQVRAGVRLPTLVRDAIARTLADAGSRPLALVVRQPGRLPRRIVGRVIRWESPHLTIGLGASGRHRGVAILRADRLLSVEPLG